MKQLLIIALFLSFSLSGIAQADSSLTNTTTNDVSFLDFVKKVTFNPTILLKKQHFKSAHNVQLQLLPANTSQSPQAIKGFEKAMQKIIRFLLESGTEGIVRYYFNPNHPRTPFSVVVSEELHCKFTSEDLDSITKLLNIPFQTSAINYNNAALFEGAIQAGLDYTGKCLIKNRAKCGPIPENLITEINTKPLSIKLENVENSKYDLDEYKHENYASYYAEVYDLYIRKNVYVPAKLMITGEANEPLAIAITKNDPTVLKQNFSVKNMTTNQVLELKSGSTPEKLFIQLPNNLPPNQRIEFGIFYKSTVDSITYTVGSFIVHTFTKKTINVHLVSVNNASVDRADIQDALNKHYSPVGVNFLVQPVINLNKEDDWATNITMESSGLFYSYTKELRDYVGAVRDLDNYSKDDYYLVFGLTSSVDGYMPRKSNIGFVFTTDSLARTVAAHELGHGAFHLRHIFSEDELGEGARGTTENLMDYVNNPKDLYVPQWLGIDDPVSVGWFEGDDEEGWYNVSKADYKCIPYGVTFTSEDIYINLDGEKIKLEDGYEPYFFVGETTGLEGRLLAIRNSRNGEIYYAAAKINAKGYYNFKLNEIVDTYEGILYDGNKDATLLTSVGNEYQLRKGETVLHFYFEHGKDCPGIPRSNTNNNNITRTCGTIDTLINKAGILACLLDTDINHSADNLSKLIVRESDCAIYNLDFSIRTRIIGRLLQHDGSWELAEQNILNKVIKNTPRQYEVSLLESFQDNNYQWLKLLHDQLSEYLDLNDKLDLQVAYQVYGSLSKMVQRNYNQLTFLGGDKTLSFISPEVSNILLARPSQIYSIDVPYASFPIFIGGNAGTRFNLGRLQGIELPTNYGSQSGFVCDFEFGHSELPFEFDNGYIKVYQRFTVKEIFDGFSINSPGMSPQDFNLYSLTETYSVDPFQYVDLVFAKNYGAEGYTEGQSIFVPSFYALLIQQSILNNQFDENFRQVTNLVEIVAGMAAIVSAPITLGSSIAVFAGVVGAIDLAIQNSRTTNNLTSEEYNSDFFKNWDAIKGITDIAMGIYALPSLAKFAIKMGNTVLRNGRHLYFAIAFRKAVKNTHLKPTNVSPKVINLADEISEGVRLGVDDVTYYWKGVKEAGRFIANSGTELRTYLDDLVTLPAGKTYSGKIYRYKTTGASYNVTDINPNMNPLENRFKSGLYASTSSDGNYLEAMGNGGITGKTQYEVTNVQINNLLDLTDDNIIQQLGTSFDQMKLSGVINKYEYTHVVADWAKSKGYSGVRFYGAQGSGTVYENIILFEQTTVNNAITNSSINPVAW